MTSASEIPSSSYRYMYRKSSSLSQYRLAAFLLHESEKSICYFIRMREAEKVLAVLDNL